MHQRMRALHKKLDLQTYAHDKLVTFTIKSPALRESALVPVPIMGSVLIPVPIMYRFYHLGRAYDMDQIVNHFHPSGRVMIPFVPLQLLTQELEQIANLVVDPVIQHYCHCLTTAFKSVRTDTSSMVLIHEP